MGKEDSYKFLREFDRFGQPVGLTYKNNPSYNTPIGGVFTMVTFCIFMCWLAMEVIDVYMPPGKHSVSTSETVTQKLNGTWPVQEMSMDEFFVSYKLHTGHYETAAKGQEDLYFSGIWVQRS